MNQGREGEVTQTLISSHQHKPYPSCNRGPIWQNSGEHMVKSMGWGPTAQFWNPIVPFTTRVLDTGGIYLFGPKFPSLWNTSTHIISTYMMDSVWWLKVNIHQLLLICTIYYQSIHSLCLWIATLFAPSQESTSESSKHYLYLIYYIWFK